jgi:hypothetical protein
MHPATEAIVRWFKYEHLPTGKARDTSKLFAVLAHELVGSIPDGGAELTAGLRKLLEAKDCAVRAALS